MSATLMLGSYIGENGKLHKIKRVCQQWEDALIEFVPVVRCKNCEHRSYDGNDKPYCLKLEMYLNKELDFFCAYGK